MSEYFGFQPAVATNLDRVVAAMTVSHDVLVARAGRRRTSGVTWEIWGPELAGVLARTKTGVSVRGDGDHVVCGSLEDGLVRLDELVAAPGPGEHPKHVDHDRSAIKATKAVARAHPDATLIIAYCDVAAPDRARQ